MRNLPPPPKDQWTGTRTITAVGKRTCIITLRLSDFKSQTSLTLLLRHSEFTNENVSYFLTTWNNQSKTKTFIDLKVNRKRKPTKNSTRPYLNEIPAHFTHEIKTKGYGVIGVNLSHFKLMRFHFQRKGLTGASPTTRDFTIGPHEGSENVASKMNLLSFGLYGDYSNSLTSSNAGEPSRSWISKNHIQV